MKAIRFIIILLIISLNSFCQKESVFDTSFTNVFSKVFFEKNPAIDSVVIENGNYSVYTKTKWQKTASLKNEFRGYDFYHANFLGDIYRFEKKYGQLVIPEKELAIIKKKGCNGWCRLKVAINIDSVKCELICNCITDKSSDDFEFFHVETGIMARIKGETSLLQEKIQTGFDKIKQHTKVDANDSILIFKVLVDNKDSCLQSIKLTDGNFSPFAEMVINVLQENCLWLPAEQGGRPVKFLSQVFICLNERGNITVDILK